MKKKFSSVIFLILVLVVSLWGCGEKTPSYPDMGDVNMPENAKTGENEDFSAQFDGEKWIFDDSIGSFAIYDKEVYEAGNPDKSCGNINAIVSDEYEGPLTQEDLDSMTKSMESMGMSGYTIKSKELKSLEGETVIYYESEVELTDEMIDFLVENGGITESQIEELGGREELKKARKTNQTGVCAIIDGRVVIFTGSYYSEDEKDDTLEAIKVLIHTGKVKA